MSSELEINFENKGKQKQAPIKSSSEKRLPQRDIQSDNHHQQREQMEEKKRCFIYSPSQQTKMEWCPKENQSSLAQNKPSTFKGLKEIRIKENFLEPGKLIKNCFVQLYITNKVDNNEAYRCSYLLFHVCYMLILSITLSLYENKDDLLYIHYLFKMEIKAINFLKSRLPKQLDQIQCIDAMATALSYRNGEKHIIKIKSTLKQFLHRHQTKMLTFMPVYYAYFRLIAHKQELLSSNPTLAEIQKLINQTEQGFTKLHNDRY